MTRNELLYKHYTFRSSVQMNFTFLKYYLVDMEREKWALNRGESRVQ